MNTHINDGGPLASGMEVYRQGERELLFAVGGLTIRDWFAGMAMQGGAMYVNEHEDHYQDSLTRLAEASYRIADAMLLARLKNHEALRAGE